MTTETTLNGGGGKNGRTIVVAVLTIAALFVVFSLSSSSESNEEQGILAAPAGSTFEIGDLMYDVTVTNSQVAVRAKTPGAVSGDLTIPSTVEHPDEPGSNYSVTSIRADAFRKCSKLTTVTIPDSVISIGDSAFSGCTNMTSITIGSSVESIGDHAFRECSKLTTVTIPDSVKSIGAYAFLGCTNMTSITIGSSVESIGAYAFSNCSKLTTVTIPDSVKSIGAYAFSNCSKLTTVTIPDSVNFIDKWAFLNCPELKVLAVPVDVLLKYNSLNAANRVIIYYGGATSVTATEKDGAIRCEVEIDPGYTGRIWFEHLNRMYDITVKLNGDNVETQNSNGMTYYVSSWDSSDRLEIELMPPNLNAFQNIMQILTILLIAITVGIGYFIVKRASKR